MMCLDIIFLEDHPMGENRNLCLGNPSSQSRTTVCIDTYRVLDSCRDRDCYEDKRVYLTSYGQDLVSGGGSVRAKCASILWSCVGVEPVMLNRGFFRVTVKTYIILTLEICTCGRAQEFDGLVILEKSVILYGGEGEITSFRSDPNAGFCDCPIGIQSTSLPIAVVESVPPIVLGIEAKRACCLDRCDEDSVGNNGCCNACLDIPEGILDEFDGPLITGDVPCVLTVSIGIFSVIRIERPAQLLVEASDYSVPDKECISQNENNPCASFRRMPFPIEEFSGNVERGIGFRNERRSDRNENGSCGCRGKSNG